MFWQLLANHVDIHISVPIIHITINPDVDLINYLTFEHFFINVDFIGEESDVVSGDIDIQELAEAGLFWWGRHIDIHQTTDMLRIARLQKFTYTIFCKRVSMRGEPDALEATKVRSVRHTYDVFAFRNRLRFGDSGIGRFGSILAEKFCQ